MTEKVNYKTKLFFKSVFIRGEKVLTVFWHFLSRVFDVHVSVSHSANKREHKYK